MGINFGYKKNQEEQPKQAVESKSKKQEGYTTKPEPKESTSKLKGGVLKRGDAARKALAAEEYKTEKAKAEAGNRLFRFFIKDGEETSITFLDGELDNGMLDGAYFFEHNVLMNGKWGNFFVCLQEEEPCPVCETTKSKSSYVCLLTVIDHSSYKAKDGKTYKDQVKLFAAKRETVQILQKIAVKRGGLTGCRFDVSRSGDKSASVGSMFDFVDKSSMATIRSKYGKDVSQIDYEEYIGSIYHTAKELKKLGFGSSVPAVGSESDDYDDKL